MRKPITPLRALLLLLAAAAVYGLESLSGGGDQEAASVLPTSSRAESSGADRGAAILAQAFLEQLSGLVVEATGEVVKLLPDDREGSRHQRFILRLEDGRTLLFAHNIDLADRVPLARGDRIRFRGQYEWNERGGLIHWTHHDPDGDRPGGWIRHDAQLYR